MEGWWLVGGGSGGEGGLGGLPGGWSPGVPQVGDRIEEIVWHRGLCMQETGEALIFTRCRKVPYFFSITFRRTSRSREKGRRGLGRGGGEALKLSPPFWLVVVACCGMVAGSLLSLLASSTTG